MSVADQTRQVIDVGDDSPLDHTLALHAKAGGKILLRYGEHVIGGYRLVFDFNEYVRLLNDGTYSPSLDKDRFNALRMEPY